MVLLVLIGVSALLEDQLFPHGIWEWSAVVQGQLPAQTQTHVCGTLSKEESDSFGKRNDLTLCQVTDVTTLLSGWWSQQIKNTWTTPPANHTRVTFTEPPSQRPQENTCFS